MAKTLKKNFIEENVYDLAVQRVNHIFDKFDHVAVSFSGGKDSTVCLNIALQIAKERNRLPLEVIFYDEEAMPPETFDYVRRVSNIPEIDFKWLCLPIKHRNACSATQPYWYPWAEEDRALWCYPLPDKAIREWPGFVERVSIPENSHLLFDHKKVGTVGFILGIRADESMRRYMSVSKREVDNYISPTQWDRNCFQCKPIYDWRDHDVWAAPKKFGWDWNRTYDLYDKIGMPLHMQRVAPPYGEEPFQRLWSYAVCWPELWEKMLYRVPGAATAGRFSRSPLYFRGGGLKGWNPKEAPEAQIKRELEKWPEKDRITIATRIDRTIKTFKARNPYKEIPTESKLGTQNDVSWKYLYMLAEMGDLKGRRTARYESEEDYRNRLSNEGEQGRY